MELEVLIRMFLYGTGIGIGLYFAPYVKQFLLYLKGGIENQNGKLEHKDLQLVIFSVLSIFIVISSANGVKYSDALVYSVFLAATGIYASKEYFQNKIK